MSNIVSNIVSGIVLEVVRPITVRLHDRLNTSVTHACNYKSGVQLRPDMTYFPLYHLIGYNALSFLKLSL